MGLLSDFFVSTEMQAIAYARRSSLLDLVLATTVGPKEWKGLYSLHFSMLQAILLGEEHDGARHQLQNVKFTLQDSSASLDRFPSDYVALLASLTDDQARLGALRWIETEEMHGWDIAEACMLLEDIRALARSRRVFWKSLYMTCAL